jgi:hypothetical protein
MKKLVNGELVDLSPVDIAQINAEVAAFTAEKPVKDWEAEMAKADKDMPRYAENIIASMDAEQFARLDKKTQLDYNTKIAKRAEKP